MLKFYRYFFLVFGLLAIVHVQAQIDINALDIAYQQDFNALASTGTSNEASTLPAGWTFIEVGSNANTTYASGTGSSNTGNTYSFGLDANDRALGGLLSGSLSPMVGASFINNTGTTVTSLALSYRGEQWRLGAADRGADRLDFQYSLNATALNTGDWVDVDTLDFTSTVTTGSTGAVNGNDPAAGSSITFEISNLLIENGDTFLIRWLDFNAPSADDGLAIDDFSLVATGIPTKEPSIVTSVSALDFGAVDMNTTSTLSYNVSGFNLEEAITITSSDAAYSVSSDNVNFYSSITLPQNGGEVYVRFSPTLNGTVSTLLTHTSGATTLTLHASGNGFDQTQNIIPIVTARMQAVGTTVTVAGRITVADELGNPAYVQDDTGGLPVFDSSLANAVAIGDSVIITGPLGVFYEQIQISGNGIFFSKVETLPRIIEPKSIALTEVAAHEGFLVTVQNVSLVNPNFVFYPQSTERITDGSTQVDLRIDGDTDIPGLLKPQGTFDVTGVVGRFRASTQLLPRFAADIPGVTEPTAAADSIPKSQTLDIVTWNFEFFGARKEDYGNEEFGPEDEALQLQNIKQVLDSLQADIIAVQEVSDEEYFAQLVAQLENYNYSCSQRFSYSFDGPSNTFPPQKVCFIYDTTTINTVTTRVLFENSYDEGRTTNPSLLPSYPGGSPSSFYSSGRLPYLLTANVVIDGVEQQISFINIHAKSGAAIEDRSRRAYDAQVLKDTLDAHFANEQFVILGDLNDDLDQSITPGLASPYEIFVVDTMQYSPITKALSDIGARSTTSFNDMIDHQIISNELQQEFLPGSQVVITPFSYIPNYAATTSDHLPVLTRYAFDAPVVNFEYAQASVSEDTTTFTVTFTISEPSTKDQSFLINITGTADYGNDYTTTPSAEESVLEINLKAGETSASFNVQITNDVLDEVAEIAVFTLQAGTGTKVGNQPSFTLTIKDNDVPTIYFSKHVGSAEEGSDETINISLSTPPATTQYITLQVYNALGASYGKDYVTTPSINQDKINVEIAAGSTQASINISALSDTRRELPIEIVTFCINEASSGLKLSHPRIFLFSIIDVKKKTAFAVFPNPTFGIADLVSSDLSEDDQVKVDLCHENGNRLLSRTGTLKALNGQIGTTIQNGRKGVYILRVQFEGELYTLRVLKL